MIPVQIRFTRKVIEHIDKLIESGVYSSRSEAIRDATRRLVINLSSSDLARFSNPGTEVRNPDSQNLKSGVDDR